VEPPAVLGDQLPALGEAGADRKIRAARREAFVDVAEIAEREGLVEAVGVERADVSLERHFERLGAGRPGQQAHDEAGHEQPRERHGNLRARRFSACSARSET